MIQILIGTIIGIYGGIYLNIPSFFVGTNIYNVLNKYNVYEIDSIKIGILETIKLLIIFLLLNKIVVKKILNKKRESKKIKDIKDIKDIKGINCIKYKKHKIISFFVIILIATLFYIHIKNKEKYIDNIINLNTTRNIDNSEKLERKIEISKKEKESEKEGNKKDITLDEEKSIFEILIIDRKLEENKYKNKDKDKVKVKVKETKEKKEKNEKIGKSKYVVKVLSINGKKEKLVNKMLYGEIYAKLKIKKELQIGKKYIIKADLEKFTEERNYKGFNAKIYNYSNNIYCNIVNHSNEIKEVKEIKIKSNKNLKIKKEENKEKEKLEKEDINIRDKIYILINRYKEGYSEFLKSNMKNYAIFKGLILGDVDDISEEIKEEFKETNIYHLLAISGSHIVYLVLITKFLKNKLKFGKIINHIIIIFLILFYIIISGFSSSVLRAGIIVMVKLAYELLNKKYNFERLSILTIFLILIIYPYKITDIGLYLSYGGVIGIIIYQKIKEYVKVIIQKIYLDNRVEREVENENEIEKEKLNTKNKVIDKVIINLKKLGYTIIDIIGLSISVQIIIWPIIAMFFNNINLNFIISNLIIATTIDMLIFIGVILLPIYVIKIALLNIAIINILKIIDYIIEYSVKINAYFANIEGLKIYVGEIHITNIIIYYYLIYLIIKLLKRISNEIEIKNEDEKESKRIVLDIIKKIIKFIAKLVIIFIIAVIVSKLIVLTKKTYAEVNFLDVGQGDTSYIKTKEGKTILIDTAEGESSKYPIGKKIVFPYLLKKGVKKLDYLIISHFDSDHSGGAKHLIENMEVENVLIPKQYMYTKQYILFITEIINQRKKGKKINVRYVRAGETIYVDKNTKIYIYGPEKEYINKKILNNNSLVCMVLINGKKILYTGDIEKEAEELLIKRLTNTNIEILKIPHHGSKTSTSEEFISKINAKEYVISVGKNNIFGHPSKIVLDRLIQKRGNIRRTDKEGEIKYIFD